MQKGFDPLPKEVVRGATGGVKEDTAERPDVDASDYDYLTMMSVSSFTEEYLQHLLELKKRFEIKVGILRKASTQCLKSDKEPALLGSNYKYAQSGRDAMIDMAASQISQAAPRRQHKRTAAESLEASASLMDDDEEDQATEIKDQFQEHTETECSQKQERKKQRKRRKKQRKESGAPIHCCRALDFQGHDKSGDDFLVKEINGIASGLDGIEITHYNRDRSTVAREVAKLTLRDASVSL